MLTKNTKRNYNPDKRKCGRRHRTCWSCSSVVTRRALPSARSMLISCRAARGQKKSRKQMGRKRAPGSAGLFIIDNYYTSQIVNILCVDPKMIQDLEFIVRLIFYVIFITKQCLKTLCISSWVCLSLYLESFHRSSRSSKGLSPSVFDFRARYRYVLLAEPSSVAVYWTKADAQPKTERGEMNKRYRMRKIGAHIKLEIRCAEYHEDNAEPNKMGRIRRRRGENLSGGKLLIECSVNLASSSSALTQSMRALIGKYSFKCFFGFAAKAGPIRRLSSDRCVGSSVSQLASKLRPLLAQRRSRYSPRRVSVAFTSLGHIWRHFFWRIIQIARVIIIIFLCISLVQLECSLLSCARPPRIKHPLECCR